MWYLPSELFQVHFREDLCGASVFVSTSLLCVAHSRIPNLCPFVFSLQCGSHIPHQSSFASLPSLAFQSPCTTRLLFLQLRYLKAHILFVYAIFLLQYTLYSFSVDASSVFFHHWSLVISGISSFRSPTGLRVLTFHVSIVIVRKKLHSWTKAVL